jgi:DNA replication and repair protein RecF
VLALLATAVREVLDALAPDAAGVVLSYEASVTPGADREATRSTLRVAFETAQAGDLRRGFTQVGPHRDDVSVRLGRADARTAVSRGEQRLLALALRLAVAVVVGRRHGDGPVLLLDDILSELDRGVGDRVLAWLESQGQVVYTATDAQPAAMAAGVVWHVAEGRRDAGGALARRMA